MEFVCGMTVMAASQWCRVNTSFVCFTVDTTNQNGVDPPGSGSPVNLGSTSAIGKDKAPKRSFEVRLTSMCLLTAHSALN